MSFSLIWKISRSVLFGLLLVPKDLAWAQSQNRAPADVQSSQTKKKEMMKSEMFITSLHIVRMLNATDLINVVVGSLKVIEAGLDSSGWQRCPQEFLRNHQGQFLFFVKELRCYNAGSENPGLWVGRFYKASDVEKALFFASIEDVRMKIVSN